MNYYHNRSKTCFASACALYSACALMTITTITLAMETRGWWALVTWMAAIGLFFAGKLAAYDYRRYKARAAQNDATRIRIALHR